MEGHLPMEQVIGVRIPGGQPNPLIVKALDGDHTPA